MENTSSRDNDDNCENSVNIGRKCILSSFNIYAQIVCGESFNISLTKRHISA